MDLGARLHDAAIGRMHQVDGLADAFGEVSPFSFGLNNPVMNIDPTGDSTVPAAQVNWKTFDTKTNDIGLNAATVTAQRQTDGGGGSSSAQQQADQQASYREVLSQSPNLQRVYAGFNIAEKAEAVGGSVDAIESDNATNFALGSLVSGTISRVISMFFAKSAQVAAANTTSTSLWPAAYGGRKLINGIEYTTHALERMQPVGTIMKGTASYSRGIPPSVVENALRFGNITPGNTTAEVVRTFENIRVITNPAGTRVISVIKIGQ